MKKFYHLFFLAMFLFTSTLSAQTRYLNEVFTDVTKTPDVTYGFNATVLYYSVTGQAVPDLLKLDLYKPTTDTETGRPLVLVLHTGNFLPFVKPFSNPPELGFNGSCGGTRGDSSIVRYCNSLAKMGYVSAAVGYRLGWNPLAATDVDRRYGIINAAYRGIQDVRTAIRYFKKTVKEFGNPHGIDTTKIVIFGQGTGGYIALGAATLDSYGKIPSAPGGKFIWDHDANPNTNPIPMIVPQVNGNIDGTSVGQVPNANPGVPNGLDTLCYPQHVGYTSSFKLMVNLGGALADTSWMDPGQPAMISYHVPTDNFAPYGQGIVNVPGTNLQVVEVQGSYAVQHLAEDFGNNAAFGGLTYETTNQVQAFAESPAGFKDLAVGLYPFNVQTNVVGGVPIPTTTAPWEWTSFVPVAPATCNNDKAISSPYIDTIIRFYAPRACFALGLQGCINKILSDKEPLAPLSIELTAVPNPASEEVMLQASSTIERIAVYDRYGRVVRSVNGIDADQYLLRREGLAAGTYFVKTSFKEGFKTQEVIFQ